MKEREEADEEEAEAFTIVLNFSQPEKAELVDDLIKSLARKELCEERGIRWKRVVDYALTAQRGSCIFLLGPLLPGVINGCMLQFSCVHTNYTRPFVYMVDEPSIPCWIGDGHASRIRLSQLILVALLALAAWRTSFLEVEVVMFRPSMSYAMLRFLVLFSISLSSCGVAEHLHVISDGINASKHANLYDIALNAHTNVNLIALLALIMWHFTFDADRGFARVANTFRAGTLGFVLGVALSSLVLSEGLDSANAINFAFGCLSAIITATIHLRGRLPSWISSLSTKVLDSRADDADTFGPSHPNRDAIVGFWTRDPAGFALRGGGSTGQGDLSPDHTRKLQLDKYTARLTTRLRACYIALEVSRVSPRAVRAALVRRYDCVFNAFLQNLEELHRLMLDVMEETQSNNAPHLLAWVEYLEEAHSTWEKAFVSRLVCYLDCGHNAPLRAGAVRAVRASLAIPHLLIRFYAPIRRDSYGVPVRLSTAGSRVQRRLNSRHSSPKNKDLAWRDNGGMGLGWIRLRDAFLYFDSVWHHNGTDYRDRWYHVQYRSLAYSLSGRSIFLSHFEMRHDLVRGHHLARRFYSSMLKILVGIVGEQSVEVKNSLDQSSAILRDDVALLESVILALDKMTTMPQVPVGAASKWKEVISAHTFHASSICSLFHPSLRAIEMICRAGRVSTRMRSVVETMLLRMSRERGVAPHMLRECIRTARRISAFAQNVQLAHSTSTNSSNLTDDDITDNSGAIVNICLELALTCASEGAPRIWSDGGGAKACAEAITDLVELVKTEAGDNQILATCARIFRNLMRGRVAHANAAVEADHNARHAWTHSLAAPPGMASDIATAAGLALTAVASMGSPFLPGGYTATVSAASGSVIGALAVSVDENSSQSEVRIYASDSIELDSISSSLESMGDADPIAYDGAALAHARGRHRASGSAVLDLPFWSNEQSACLRGTDSQMLLQVLKQNLDRASDQIVRSAVDEASVALELGIRRSEVSSESLGQDKAKHSDDVEASMRLEVAAEQMMRLVCNAGRDHDAGTFLLRESFARLTKDHMSSVQTFDIADSMAVDDAAEAKLAILVDGEKPRKRPEPELIVKGVPQERTAEIKERLHGLLDEAQSRHRSKIRMQEEQRLMRLRYFESTRRRDVRANQVHPEIEDLEARFAPARDWRRDMRGNSGIAQGKIGPGPSVPVRIGDKYGTVARVGPSLDWMEGVFQSKNAAALRSVHAMKNKQSHVEPSKATTAKSSTTSSKRQQTSKWRGQLDERRKLKEDKHQSMLTRWYGGAEGAGQRYRPNPGGRLPAAWVNNNS